MSQGDVFTSEDGLAAGPLEEKTRAALRGLCADLSRELGKKLEAVVLHGSAARGDYIPGRSDVNVLVVVDAVTLEACDAALAPWRMSQRDAPIVVDLMTTTDLERSTDVFPLRFLNMQRGHTVLWGEDVLGGLDIQWDHLRLRVEQVIKVLLFDLRETYMRHASRPEVLGGALSRAFGSYLIAVGALLFLKDGDWWLSGKEKIAEVAARELDLDEPLMEKLLELHRGELEPTPAQVRSLYESFMALVEVTADVVDQLEEQE
jgi:predicted nucleotidyltransferase